MKKTFNINIGGFFYTIEESAYLKLNTYLESLKKYFSTYESCEEIIQDIESRIAEKFFEKYQTTNIIEIDDVDKIIESMGSVSDFEALKEEEDLTDNFSQQNTQSNHSLKPRNLYKDDKRKAVSGVLAGLAHKYDIDVVWVRVLFLALAIGLIPLGVGVALIALYLVGWLVLPAYYNLEENPKVRKYYRDSEDKVLGGVASGLAKYFKTDVKLVRILFVLLIIPGIPFYILIWIFAPVANSVTEQLQLKGKAITIQNIEQSVKNQNSENIPPQKSTLSKILLLPFTIIAAVIRFLGKLIRPIGSIIRVFTGLIVLITGICFGLASLIALGAFFGAQSATDWISIDPGFEFNKIITEIPVLGIIFLFFACFIPALVLTILGYAIILGKIIGNKVIWSTLLAVWLIGFVGSISMGTTHALKFSKTAEDVQNEVFKYQTNETIIFDIKSDNTDGAKPRIWFHTSDDNELKIEVKRKSQGSNHTEALTFAKAISYKARKEENTVLLDRKFIVPAEDPFRNQELILDIYVPKGFKFKFSKNFLDYFGYPYNFSVEPRDYSGENIFIYENEELKCTNCPEINPYDVIEREDFLNDFQFETSHFEERKIQVSAFTNLKIKSPVRVILTQGDSTKISAYGSNHEELNEIKVSKNDNNLEIDFIDPFKEHNERIYLVITTPKISKVEISNKAMLKMYGFDKLPTFSMKAENSSKAALHLNVQKFFIEANTKSHVIVQGEINNLEAISETNSIVDARKSSIDLLHENTDGTAVIESSNPKKIIKPEKRKDSKRI